MFGNEVKLSLFADDINLFIADLASVKRGFKIVEEFGGIAGLCLNVKKTKAIWLGKMGKEFIFIFYKRNKGRSVQTKQSR